MSSGGWASVGSVNELPEGKGRRVVVGEAPVLVVRAGERVFAIGARCTHQGAPLDRGVVRVGGTSSQVTCPAHGSMFDLESGRVLRGPATQPEPSYEVRVADGLVEIRLPDG